MSVSAKIITAFLSALLIFGAFDFYLSSALDANQALTLTIKEHYATLNDLSSLPYQNSLMNDAVKSFALTHDPSWRTAYLEAYTSIEGLLATANGAPDLTPADKSSLGALQELFNNQAATDFAVFSASGPAAPTASGVAGGAIAALFSPSYLANSSAIAGRINALITFRANYLDSLVGESNAALANLHSILFALYVFFSLVFILIWTGIARGVTRPIRRLTDAAQRIGAGDLAATAAVDSGDEIGTLAETFNTMAGKIREAYARIENDEARLLASINSLSLGYMLLDAHGGTVMTNGALNGLCGGATPTLEEASRRFTAAVPITETYRRMIVSKANDEIPEAACGDRFFRIFFAPILPAGPAGENRGGREAIGAVIIFEDITDEKRLEQEKSAFVAIASHEMRTPLTVIRGNAELLLGNPRIKGDETLARQLGNVLKDSVRLLNIVNDFLDVQHIEEGKISFAPEPLDLAGILRESAADLAGLAAKKGLAISFDASFPPALPPFTLDKYRLEQIYTNLVSNALNYTEHGGVTIGIERTTEGARIRFADTGIGIASEEQARLFGKFQTGKIFLRSKEYGSGLGLYISRLLARLMGGELALEKSVVGKGSTFVLALPFAMPSIDTGAVPSAGMPARGVGAPADTPTGGGPGRMIQ